MHTSSLIHESSGGKAQINQINHYSKVFERERRKGKKKKRKKEEEKKLGKEKGGKIGWE